MTGNTAEFPEGSPWEWGELSQSEVLQLSAMTRMEDGPSGLLFQYGATRTVLALRPGIEAGSGFDVLEAVAECARCGLVMPDWLARAYLARYRAVSQAKAKSWDDPLSFGAPYPKGTNINAMRKARVKGLLLYVTVSKLMDCPPHMTLNKALIEAGEKLSIGKTLAEEYFRTHQKRFNAMLGGKSRKKSQPAKSINFEGRQKHPR